MRRLVLIALAAGLVVAPVADAVTKHDVVTATVHKSGRSGTALVYKGTVHSKVFGRGKVVQKVYPNLKGSFVITYAKGKTMGVTTTKTDPQPGGQIKVTGTFRFTGGTGRYKNVHGTGKYKGTSDADLQRATFRQEGNVSF